MTTAGDIRALLLELELDIDRRLLDSGSLSGLTAERWAPASAALQRAWENEGRVEGVEDAAALVSEVGAIWERLTPRLAALGEGREQERLMAALRADPLGFDPASIDALEEAAELREQASARLDAARELLGRVEEAQRSAETAHREVLEKVGGAQVPAPRQALSELDTGLRAVESLLAQEAWSDAGKALVAWTNEATRELDQARAVAAANRAPLERRNQLRGLLKAYEAKARGVRALEREEVAGLFEQAERALYSAPVDLDAAADLVERYGGALR